MRYIAVVPSHLARSSTLIGSSLGGLSLGGSLGANFLDSAMADACGIFDEETIESLIAYGLTFSGAEVPYRMSRQYWVPGCLRA